MKKIVWVCVIAIGVFAWPGLGHADTGLDKRIWQSHEVLREFLQMPEEDIPPNLLRRARAIAVFPNMVKVGFIVAGQFGKGIVIHRDESTAEWSAPAFFRIGGGSFGFQIGAQTTDVVLVITNERGVRALLMNKLTLGADASVAAGPVGRTVDASTDWKMTASILSYSRSKGLFGGVALDGVILNQDYSANEKYYGARLSANDILLEGKGSLTEEAKKLIATIEKHTK